MRLLHVLAVGAELLGHPVVAGVAEVAARLGQRPRPRASAVQPPLLLITTTTGILWRTAVSISIALMPKEPSPCSTSTCVSGLATFAPTPNGRPTPIVPNGARVQPVAGHVGRDGLAAEVQDLLAVHHQDGVAPHEVADLLAEPQRVDRRLVAATSPCPARRPSRRRARGACRSRPRSASGSILPSASARSCSSTARASPAIGTSTSRLWPSSAGLMSTWITLRSAREARRPAELDHPVEARAHRQHHVGLGEGLAARVQERQLVVLGDQAARDRRGVERDAGGLHEGLERGGAVRPPHAAARDDHRALGLREQRDGLLAPRRDRPGVRGAGFHGPG